MTFRCPICNEWLFADKSSAMCADITHGGVFPGVTQRDIIAAQKAEADAAAESNRRRLLLTTPKAVRIREVSRWRIEGVVGIYSIGCRCLVDYEPKNGEVVALNGVATCYRFRRCTQFEKEVRVALGLPEIDQ